MKLKEDITKSLSLANNTSAVGDDVFKKLIEFTFTQLVGTKEPNLSLITNSNKPDVMKELFAALLTAAAEFARSNSEEESVHNYLTKECGYVAARAKLFAGEYARNKIRLQIKLGNVGTHLPHVVDIEWKIDYIVKASTLDLSEGPIFRVALITEKHDETNDCKKMEAVRFSCTSEELQDLVYKLRDAARHCHKIAGE